MERETNIITIQICLAVIILCMVALNLNSIFRGKTVEPQLTQPTAQVSMNPYLFETIENKIVRLAKESDVLPETALRIARCESNLDPLAENDKSSASGIYQFLDGTFESYCEGDVYNPKDNIKCFLKYYPEHSGWWICK